MELQMKRMEDGVVYLVCRGDLDYEVAEEFYSTVCDIASKTILVDFADVEFVDSTGIGALCRVIEAVQAEKGEIRVVNIEENVYEILKLVGCIDVFGDTILSAKDHSY